MAWDNIRKEFARHPFSYVEIEVDGTTYRMCRDVTPLPSGFNGRAALLTLSLKPATIDLAGGLGIRASATAKIREFPDYTTWGTITEPVDFWKRWRAENPYYKSQRISVFSGYLVDNHFDSDNFIQRDYVIDSFALADDGVSIGMVDPLKLANDSFSQYPKASSGVLAADVLAADTSITLLPSGIGDEEYPASDFYIQIDDERMFCTSRTDDVLTVTRGQWNSIAEDHDEDGSVQLCVWYDSKTVAEIAYDIAINAVDFDLSPYINYSEWESESENAFPETYTALITSPEGANSLFKELAKSAPFYIYYDDRNNTIPFKALLPPPEASNALTSSGNLLKGSTKVTDMHTMRKSAIIMYYGMRDPSGDMDDVNNFSRVSARGDIDSLTNYKSVAYETIFSRFISEDNKTAAKRASARIGRRFASTPRQITYNLDAKDADKWTGDSVTIESNLIVEPSTGDVATIVYQITSAGENISSNNFSYTALEHTYGPPVSEDDDVEEYGVILIYISGEYDQLKDVNGNVRTLRDYYDDIQTTLESDYDVRFIIESSAVCGASAHGQYSVDTGSWPELTTPPLIELRGPIVGKGGDAGYGSIDGRDGGHALILNNDVRINNLSFIGGGGGGGAGETVADEGGTIYTSGGGGAGYFVGKRSTFGYYGEDGTLETGGAGVDDGEYTSADGGDLGQAGGSNSFADGGAAGIAINANGYTVTWISTGTIYGAII